MTALDPLAAVGGYVDRLDIGRIVAGVEIVTPKITADGLTINTVNALGESITFNSDTIFFGRPYFTSDTAGFAVVKKGEREVVVSFDREYLEQPIVNASISLNETTDASKDIADAEAIFGNDIRYLITKKTVKGFTILLNKGAINDTQLSWTAFAVKGAKTFESVLSVSSGTTPPTVTGTSPEPTPVVAEQVAPISEPTPIVSEPVPALVEPITELTPTPVIEPVSAT